MKKFLSIALAAILAVSIAGCSASASPEIPSSFSQTSESSQESGVIESDAEATAKPSAAPDAEETAQPAITPTPKATAAPTVQPTQKPTVKPTATPTAKPTPKPTAKPTPKPTAKPTPKPTAKPTVKPTPEAVNGSPAQSTTVWLSRTGTKYHSNPNCGNMKNPIESTLEDAIASGREPCKKCYG